MDRTVVEEGGAWVESGLLFLIALTVTLRYALTDGSPLLWDEYYHLLAARSWVETGTLVVGDGAYVRGAWFSVIVGWMFRTMGESIIVARCNLSGTLKIA